MVDRKLLQHPPSLAVSTSVADVGKIVIVALEQHHCQRADHALQFGITRVLRSQPVVDRAQHSVDRRCNVPAYRRGIKVAQKASHRGFGSKSTPATAAYAVGDHRCNTPGLRLRLVIRSDNAVEVLVTLAGNGDAGVTEPQLQQRLAKGDREADRIRCARLFDDHGYLGDICRIRWLSARSRGRTPLLQVLVRGRMPPIERPGIDGANPPASTAAMAFAWFISSVYPTAYRQQAS